MQGPQAQRSKELRCEGWAGDGPWEGNAASENRTDLLSYERHQPNGPPLRTLNVCIIQVVVLLPGASESFPWEFEQAVQLVKPEQLLFLAPCDGADMANFRLLAQRFLPHALPKDTKDALFKAQSFQTAIYFDSDWMPHYALPKEPVRTEPPGQRSTKRLRALVAACRDPGP